MGIDRGEAATEDHRQALSRVVAFRSTITVRGGWTFKRATAIYIDILLAGLLIALVCGTRARLEVLVVCVAAAAHRGMFQQCENFRCSRKRLQDRPDHQSPSRARQITSCLTGTSRARRRMSCWPSRLSATGHSKFLESLNNQQQKWRLKRGINRSK